MDCPAQDLNVILPGLARLLQRRRRQARLNLPAVAAPLGISVAALCSFEEGFAPWPGALRIREILRILGCDEPGDAFERPAMMPLHTPTADSAGEWMRSKS
jgi:hypothetical protein